MTQICQVLVARNVPAYIKSVQSYNFSIYPNVYFDNKTIKFVTFSCFLLIFTSNWNKKRTLRHRFSERFITFATSNYKSTYYEPESYDMPSGHPIYFNVTIGNNFG